MRPSTHVFPHRQYRTLLPGTWALSQLSSSGTSTGRLFRAASPMSEVPVSSDWDMPDGWLCVGLPRRAVALEQAAQAQDCSIWKMYQEPFCVAQVSPHLQ
eukprot:CAMPEP_0181440584 /NCGR_PEP_ID=MMETSP1110-20121109/23046_1 /TAXON_ID=174948 /ORGANISM="Symbiodinium sp., Strain CCMP421" /LENGTH=99 /DNA_ID=CAMNT_0023564399 /DNA_START=390 /DNA_END=689 /DNA_ORIENTATION=-